MQNFGANFAQTMIGALQAGQAARQAQQQQAQEEEDRKLQKTLLQEQLRRMKLEDTLKQRQMRMQEQGQYLDQMQQIAPAMELPGPMPDGVSSLYQTDFAKQMQQPITIEGAPDVGIPERQIGSMADMLKANRLKAMADEQAKAMAAEQEQAAKRSQFDYELGARTKAETGLIGTRAAEERRTLQQRIAADKEMAAGKAAAEAAQGPSLTAPQKVVKDDLVAVALALKGVKSAFEDPQGLKDKTGFIAGPFMKAKEWANQQTPQEARATSALAAYRNAVLKARSGGAVSEGEATRLLEEIPTLGQNTAQNLSRIQSGMEAVYQRLVALGVDPDQEIEAASKRFGATSVGKTDSGLDLQSNGGFVDSSVPGFKVRVKGQ